MTFLDSHVSSKISINLGYRQLFYIGKLEGITALVLLFYFLNIFYAHCHDAAC